MQPPLANGSDLDDLGRPAARFWTGLFGVVLPALALVVELGTGVLGAGGFFDPLPSPHYVLLIALVPATVGWCLWGSARTPRARAARSLALGAATAVALVYSLMFAPWVPFALVGVLFGGLGLLPLSPVASGLTLLLLIDRARKRGVLSWRPAALGAALALVLLAYDWGSHRVTHLLVERAASPEPSEQRAALRWLRRVGNEDALAGLARREQSLPFPYVQSYLARERDLDEPWTDWTLSETAADLYHSVTGRAHTELRGGWNSDEERLPDPWSQGRSDFVGRSNPQLELLSSDLAAVVDVPAAVAYLEWTLEVGARNFGSHEGEFHVRLPRGGVVSRATLWVDEVPREATFAKREQAREIYDGIVNRNKDPLLVSHLAGDDIFVEVFPVWGDKPARHLRLGLTVPLRSHGAGELAFNLPIIVAHNCWSALDDHTVRLEAHGGSIAVGDTLRPDPRVTDRVVWAGQLDDALTEQQLVRVVGQPTARVWAPGPSVTKDDDVVVQEVVPVEDQSASAVVLVVDGGRAMRDAQRHIAQLLERWPDTLPFGAYFAGDDVVELAPMGPATSTRREAARAALDDVHWAGGIDAAPALAEALGVARANGPSVRVLWIHGPQPVLAPRSRALWTAFTDDDRARITAVDFTACGNALVRQLARGAGRPDEGLPRIVGAAQPPGRLGHIVDWLAAGAHALQRPAVERTIVAADSPLAVRARAASADPVTDHVRRLAVAEAVARTSHEADAEARDRARALAIDAQLVTAFSSALVLESDEMTIEAGLELAREDVPVLPEPELVALLIVALAALGARSLLITRARGGAA
jgi:hypothetical protein